MNSHKPQMIETSAVCINRNGMDEARHSEEGSARRSNLFSYGNLKTIGVGRIQDTNLRKTGAIRNLDMVSNIEKNGQM